MVFNRIGTVFISHKDMISWSFMREDLKDNLHSHQKGKGFNFPRSTESNVWIGGVSHF